MGHEGMKSNCDTSSAANPYSKCGNAQCEVCYPDADLRSILQDMMDANDNLRARGKAVHSLEEEVSDFKSDVQIMRDALIWLGSSSLTGESVSQVLTSVRKKVVEALVSASAINSLEISEDSSTAQETEGDDHTEQPGSDDDRNNDGIQRGDSGGTDPDHSSDRNP